MREKITTAALAAAGIAALAGGTLAAADAAVAKRHGRHAGTGAGAARPCDSGPAALTGDARTRAEAAALAAVPGGEVERSHAARPDDPDGAVYAVDVETSDDSYVVVLEDAAFEVIKVLDRPQRGPRR